MPDLAKIVPLLDACQLLMLFLGTLVYLELEVSLLYVLWSIYAMQEL
jgi:hypothetical protein